MGKNVILRKLSGTAKKKNLEGLMKIIRAARKSLAELADLRPESRIDEAQRTDLVSELQTVVVSAAAMIYSYGEEEKAVTPMIEADFGPDWTKRILEP